MGEPCACGAKLPHAEVADCVVALRRDRDALSDVLDMMGERQRSVVARVEITASDDGKGMVLYVATNRSASDKAIAALIVTQMIAAKSFGRLTKKKETADG